MPHLLDNPQGHEAAELAVQPLPLGPGWSHELASRIDVLWWSSAVEPGEDYRSSWREMPAAPRSCSSPPIETTTAR